MKTQGKVDGPSVAPKPFTDAALEELDRLVVLYGFQCAHATYSEAHADAYLAIVRALWQLDARLRLPLGSSTPPVTGSTRLEPRPFIRPRFGWLGGLLRRRSARP